jgi:hypothetical protein
VTFAAGPDAAPCASSRGAAARQPAAVPGPAWLGSTLALLLAAGFLRIAGFCFDVLNIDEIDFALVGRSVAEGHLPYSELVDLKPPLAYVAFAPAAWAGGLSLWPMHALGILLVVATGLVLRDAVRRWTGDGHAALVAPWLFLLATLCEVPSVNSELLLALPTAAGLSWFLRAEAAGLAAWPSLPSALVSGLFFGVASLCKHQGAMPALSLGAVLLWRSLAERRATWLWRAALLGAGLVLPWALAGGVYALAGRWPEFWDWAVMRNLEYARGAGLATPAWPRLLQSTATTVLAMPALWLFAVQETLWPTARADGSAGLAPERRTESLPSRPLVTCLWLTWIPVSMGGRFYEHYYLQFAPILALVAAPRAGAWLRRLQAARRASTGVGGSTLRRGLLWPALLVLLPTLGAWGFFIGRGLHGGYPAQDPAVREIAASLRERTRPDETLFVWGHTSPLYYLSGRRPGTRYFHCSVHVGNLDPGHLPPSFDPAAHVSAPDVAATLDDLRTHEVPWLLDLSPSGIHHWDRVPLAAVPALAAAVHADYVEAGRVRGAILYRRKPAAVAP